MGRKSIERKRKPLSKKAKIWVRDLIPILQQQDLQKLTLDELAELIGKSKSTIYTYFSTKEEIYKTVVEMILDDLSFVTSDEAIQGKDYELIYRRMLLKLSEGIHGLHINFLEQIQSNFPEIWKLIEDFSFTVISNFEVIYQRGMNSGQFKTFRISLLTAMDHHFVLSMMTNSEQFQKQGMSLNDLVTEYLELRLSALK